MPASEGPLPVRARRSPEAVIDYRVYHAVNVFVLHHSWLGHGLSAVEKLAVPLLAIATVALWLFDRPGRDPKWKLASTSALAASALALLANQLIAKLIWDRPRPFADHPLAHVWGARSHDPSFPSDHASAAFAIGFAVFLYDRLVGGIFLAAAVVVGVGRVFIGVHYPADVLAGALVGFACALVVVRLGRPLIALLVGLVQRITDPVLARLWPHRAQA